MQTRSRLLPSALQTLAHCTFIYHPVACLYCSQLQTLLQEAKGKYSTNESVTLPLPEVHSSPSACDSATLSFLPSESRRLRLLLDRPWAVVSPGCPPWPFPPRSRSVFWQLVHSQMASMASTLMPPKPAGLVLYPVHTDPAGGHFTPGTSPGTSTSALYFSRWKRLVSELHACHFGAMFTPFLLFHTNCCWPLPALTRGVAVLAS